MAQTTFDFLRQRGVKVIVYLKPHGPNEWKSNFKESGRTATDLARELCENKRCSVVDERWSLSGREFTDTTAHYNAEANQRIGERIGEAIVKELRR